MAVTARAPDGKPADTKCLPRKGARGDDGSKARTMNSGRSKNGPAQEVTTCRIDDPRKQIRTDVGGRSWGLGMGAKAGETLSTEQLRTVPHCLEFPEGELLRPVSFLELPKPDRGAIDGCRKVKFLVQDGASRRIFSSGHLDHVDENKKRAKAGV